MIRKFLLFALVVFPVTGFAQETQKTAYLNYSDVIVSMPEYQQMIDSITKVDKLYSEELQSSMEKYDKESSDFYAQQDTLIESIRLRRMQNILTMRENIENFQQYAQQQMRELEESLFTPIQSKAQKAIEDVGDENKFYMILNLGNNILYASPNAIDATPLVKKKLGIE